MKFSCVDESTIDRSRLVFHTFKALIIKESPNFTQGVALPFGDIHEEGGVLRDMERASFFCINKGVVKHE